MYEYDNGFIYMPLDAAQTFFRLPEAVNAIEVFVGNPDNADDARIRLQTALGPSYRTVDWQRSNAAFISAIQPELNVMFLIPPLITVMAAFYVLAAPPLPMTDKDTYIASLRTLGATRGRAPAIFILCAALKSV